MAINIQDGELLHTIIDARMAMCFDTMDQWINGDGRGDGCGYGDGYGSGVGVWDDRYSIQSGTGYGNEGDCTGDGWGEPS